MVHRRRAMRMRLRELRVRRRETCQLACEQVTLASRVSRRVDRSDASVGWSRRALDRIAERHRLFGRELVAAALSDFLKRRCGEHAVLRLLRPLIVATVVVEEPS